MAMPTTLDPSYGMSERRKISRRRSRRGPTGPGPGPGPGPCGLGVQAKLTFIWKVVHLGPRTETESELAVPAASTLTSTVTTTTTAAAAGVGLRAAVASTGVDCTVAKFEMTTTSDDETMTCKQLRFRSWRQLWANESCGVDIKQTNIARGRV